MRAAYVGVLVAWLVSGCSAVEPEDASTERTTRAAKKPRPPADAAVSDARPPIDGGASGVDATTGGDTGARDTASTDAATRDAADAPAAPLWHRALLKSGAIVEGELVARYDHRLWWAPAQIETVALFRPGAFTATQNDRALTFVRSSDLSSLTSIAAAGASYQQSLRASQLALVRPPLDGVNHVLTGHESYHRTEDGYGDFAWDLVRKDASGARFSGAGTRNEDHLVWGADVFLPVDATVFEVARGAVDNPPGTMADALGNVVGLQVQGNFYLYLYHFQAGTIPAALAPGQRLKAGAFLGKVGNSGRSLEPHLHLTALFYDVNAPAPRSWSVPIEFANVYSAGPGDASARLFPYATPVTGGRFAAAPF